MSWSNHFSNPIVTDSGRTLRTLRDAGHYVQELSPKERQRPDWQTAITILLAAADDKDFPVHAEMAIRKALKLSTWH